MRTMFCNCYQLEHADFSGFYDTHLYTKPDMFYGCKNSLKQDYEKRPH
jgi:hypothetical protein